MVIKNFETKYNSKSFLAQSANLDTSKKKKKNNVHV